MKHQNQKNSFNPILRKHLNADALFSGIYTDFSKVSDPRQGDITISLADALMSGFAMFSLKDPSLLAFDERRGVDQNLRNIYTIFLESKKATILFSSSRLKWPEMRVRPLYKPSPT